MSTTPASRGIAKDCKYTSYCRQHVPQSNLSEALDSRPTYLELHYHATVYKYCCKLMLYYMPIDTSRDSLCCMWCVQYCTPHLDEAAQGTKACIMMTNAAENRRGGRNRHEKFRNKMSSAARRLHLYGDRGHQILAVLHLLPLMNQIRQAPAIHVLQDHVDAAVLRGRDMRTVSQQKRWDP